MGSLKTLAPWALLVLAACGDVAADGIAPRQPDAAKRTPDAGHLGSPKDAGVRDVTTAIDARDARVPDATFVDVGVIEVMDAPGPEAGPVDAGSDVHDAFVLDAFTPVGCTTTGEARGTVTTLASLAPTYVNDFDVDCAGLVLAMSTGAVLACPLTGCPDTPTVVIPAGAGDASVTGTKVRLLKGSIWFADPVQTGGIPPNVTHPPIEVNAYARDGGVGEIELQASVRGDNGIGITDLEAAGSTVFAATSAANFENGPPQAMLNALPDIDAASTPSILGGLRLGVVATPTALYVLRATETGESISFVPTVDLVPRAMHTSTKTIISFGSLVATDSVVAWQELSFVDGGDVSDAAVSYAQLPGAPDASAIVVAGLFGWSMIGAHDRHAFVARANTDGTTTIATCEALEMLAGGCTPNLLATLPSPEHFGRVVADDANVYVVIADGSTIVRIAR